MSRFQPPHFSLERMAIILGVIASLCIVAAFLIDHVSIH